MTSDQYWLHELIASNFKVSFEREYCGWMGEVGTFLRKGELIRCISVDFEQKKPLSSDINDVFMYMFVGI